MNFDYFLNMSFVDLKNSKNELYEILNQLRTHLNERDILQIKNSFNIEKDVLVYLEAGQISRSVELLQTYASMPLSLQKNHFSISELVLSTNFFVENASNRNLVYQKNPQWDNVEVNSSLQSFLLIKKIKSF